MSNGQNHAAPREQVSIEPVPSEQAEVEWIPMEQIRKEPVLCQQPEIELILIEQTKEEPIAIGEEPNDP